MEGEVLEKKEDVPLYLPRREEAVAPAKFTQAQVKAWVGKVDGARFVGVVDLIPVGTDGKQLVRWNVAKFTKLCGGREAAGSKLYGLLRDEMDRVSRQWTLDTILISREEVISTTLILTAHNPDWRSTRSMPLKEKIAEMRRPVKSSRNVLGIEYLVTK